MHTDSPVIFKKKVIINIYLPQYPVLYEAY